jgi:hypothetical protein
MVVAMACEARPLIERYGLRADRAAKGFRLYTGADCALVVSGIGKLPTAAACGYVYGLMGGGRTVGWLNVGVGGHPILPIGERLLAHKVRDATTGRVWYPPMLLEWKHGTAEVVTVEEPELDYPDKVVYDMEAAAFHAAVTRFSTGEVVHSLKVVSDNREAPADALDAAQIEDLIDVAVDDIDDVYGQLAALVEEIAGFEADPPHYRELLETCHFTVSRQHQLKRLLLQLRALYSNSEDWRAGLPADNAARLLAALEARVATAPMRLIDQ